jgi:type II secretory pathway pseudopilin PulG
MERRRVAGSVPTKTLGNSGSGARDQSGLTLVELVVVTLLIIGLLPMVSNVSC